MAGCGMGWELGDMHTLSLIFWDTIRWMGNGARQGIRRVFGAFDKEFGVYIFIFLCRSDKLF